MRRRTRRPDAAPAFEADVPDVDLELERAVLAAVLLDDGRDAVMARIGPIVRPEDFGVPAHAPVWEAMVRLAARGAPIDIHTMKAELSLADRLQAIGGVQYLGEITDTLPTLAFVEDHVQTLVALADLRATRRALHMARIASRGSESARTTGEILANVRRQLAEMPDGTPRCGDGSLAAHTRVAAADVVEAQSAAAEGRSAAVSWGLPSMDGRWTADAAGAHAFVDGHPGPLGPGQLVGVGAPPGAGKTTLVWQLVETTARAGRPALFLPGEMSGPELVKRRAAQIAGVSQTRLRSGNLDDGELAAVQSAMDLLAPLPIEVVGLAGKTAQDVRAAILAARARRGIALAVVDYLQMIALPGEKSDPQEQCDRVYALKAAAMEARIPVVIVASMNKTAQREAGGGVRLPALQDIFGSGAEYALDTMLFLVGDPEERGPEVSIKAYVTKNRGGEARNVHADLVLNLPRGEFRDADDMAQPAPVAASPAPGPALAHPDDFDDGFGGMSQGGVA